MEKEYRELKQITTSVVGIYLELAKLEKQGKKESQEYENLVSLLPKALEIEKRKYLTIGIKEKYITMNKEVIADSKRVENLLLVPSKEVLVALRMLNFMDREMYYSLLDSTSNTVQIHYYMEELFLYELVKNIYKVESSERETLIDYSYAILASSCIYGVKNLTPIPPAFSLTIEDQMAAQLSLFPKCQKLNDRLFSLTDADLTRETILSVLYLKAVLYFHPYKINAMEENNNAIQLMESFATEMKCSKVCKLLYLLNEKKQ